MLKVNAGCGPDIREGWISLDFEPRDSRVINHDMAKGLPKDLKSIDIVYSSHSLEHLTDKEGRVFLKDCFDKLKPGGILRLCLPDSFKSMRAYVNKDAAFYDNLNGFIQWEFPESRTLLDFVTFHAYQFGEHKSLWDTDKAIAVLRTFGFSKVEESQFDPEFDLNDPVRIKYSIYVQAIK